MNLRRLIINCFKTFSLIFSVAIAILFLSGCREKKIYKIGVSQCSSDDWRSKMNDEILREMLLHDDAEVEIRSADDDSEKQIEDIKYFVDNGFDILLVAPNEAISLTPVVNEVYSKGIPVIIFDRDINGDSFTSRIGVDNKGLGLAAAEYANHLLGPSVRALEIYGLHGSTPTEGRHAGFSEGIKSSGGQILGGETADWKKEKAEKVVDSLLELFPSTNLIFAHNDRMAIGAAEEARRKGRSDIKIIGIDAAPSIGIQAVADSIIDATFLYPTEGHILIQQALKILKGEEYERELKLPLSSAVDLTNADILLLQNETLNVETDKIRTLKERLDQYWQEHSAQTTLIYAVIAILILLFGILFLVLRVFWQNRRYQENLKEQNKLLEEERDKQKELNEKLEEATHSKLMFFTNVSHDLRTPLTLISEPVAQLASAGNLDQTQHTLMKIANKNVKVLQRLISHILDFRKYENDRLELNLTEIDIRILFREWVESFMSAAAKRDIEIKLTEPEEFANGSEMALDIPKIESVFFNLVSNALKYSPDNSCITVSYQFRDDKLIFTVADKGTGISRKDLGRIFDRFYRVENISSEGSGIGLSVAKAFVELHGGSISVESELSKGSVFTVVLPVRHVEKRSSEISTGLNAQHIEEELSEIEGEISFADSLPLLLVIDDNKDILELVGELLKEDYNIITASSGKEGLRKAIKYVPDIIICDVMMPGTDGMEICRRLKEDRITSHIPVLMLTACSMDEQRVKGFESGAEGYMSKPFSGEVLKAQTRALIENRKRIKDLYGQRSDRGSQPSGEEKNENSAGVRPTKNMNIENDFYNKFVELFESRIGDPDLSVETLAGEMGLERTQFYRKIKAITNYSPVEMMRRLRLKKARTLLTSTDMNVSEIGYAIGFSTPAYFTKCYREMFGETPSETRNN